ncbi:MAG: DUF5412 domain-containing protein [Oscillospiraceae bacterium]|nr:DUF5412 domain-containing protein [Oscillospiraceae bacterium]
MKKASLFVFILSVALFLSACGMKNLPQGELIATQSSPNGAYTVNAYLCDGGATVDYAIRCEIVTNETGQKRNIYWNYKEETAEISWIDDTTVKINDKTLNILTDHYDWRE